MATRSELGAQLNTQLNDLNDRVYGAHNREAGRTYIGKSDMQFIWELCAKFRKELADMQGSKETEEFLTLAPDIHGQFYKNIRLIGEAIADYELTTQRVYRSSVAHDISRESFVPFEPTRFRVYNYLESTTSRSEWGIRTYDRRGRPLTFTPGYQGPHRRSWYE